MSWRRTGKVFDPQGVKKDWWASHAQVPCPVVIDGRLRVYFSARDGDNRSHVTFAEFDLETFELTYTHPHPVLSPGDPGAFDDCGTMTSQVLLHRGRLYLFYTGWNVPTTVPWRNTTGLAVSHDGGYAFEKVPGPVLARSPIVPYMAATPWVLPWGDGWRMWYMHGLGWQDGEASYDIRAASSPDMTCWEPITGSCIPLREGERATTAGCVLLWGGKWRMWYSYRGKEGYRTDPETAYHVGYAESRNGNQWVRVDDSPLALSRDGDDWESVMQCYPRVYLHKGRLHMLYNGDGFGRTGFGHAVWTQEEK